MTVVHLSKATGVPAQTIHNWLTGVEPKKLIHIKKVASYLGLSMDSLCFGIDEKYESKIERYSEEINAGVFEVVLRRIKK